MESLKRACVAELVGTFLLVFFGCGVVHSAVLTGAQAGLWQVAIVWGIAITVAIYTVGAISGAHINPAMTIAFACWRKHPWSQVVPFVLAQLMGAMVAASLLLCLFDGFLRAKETEKGVKRGEPGSVVTAMCYGEYAPNPGALASAPGPVNAEQLAEWRQRCTPGQAIVAEFLGTLVLACVVFAVTDSRNAARPLSNLAPVWIGLTVSALISVIAPLTQACFNPARDFGPRLVAYAAGWGAVAWPGASDLSWLTIYILAPIGGAVVGGGLQHLVLGPWYATQEA